MFTPEEMQEIVAEAQAGLPQSVSMAPQDLSIPPVVRERLRAALIAAIRALLGGASS